MTFLRSFICLPFDKTHSASCLISPRSHFCSLLAVFSHCFISQWSPECIARFQRNRTAESHSAPLIFLSSDVSMQSWMLQPSPMTCRSLWDHRWRQHGNKRCMRQTELLCCCLIEFLTPVTVLCLLLQEVQLHGDVERMGDVPIAHQGDKKDSWQFYNHQHN